MAQTNQNIQDSKGQTWCFKATNIWQILVTRKPKNPLQIPGGSVYCIPCCECEQKYIGETIQTTHTRLQQHKSLCDTVLWTKVFKKLEKNNYGTSMHTLDTNHQWDFDKTKILASITPTNQRVICKTIEIFQYKKNGVTLANILKET